MTKKNKPSDFKTIAQAVAEESRFVVILLNLLLLDILSKRKRAQLN